MDFLEATAIAAVLGLPAFIFVFACAAFTFVLALSTIAVGHTVKAIISSFSLPISAPRNSRGRYNQRSDLPDGVIAYLAVGVAAAVVGAAALILLTGRTKRLRAIPAQHCAGTLNTNQIDPTTALAHNPIGGAQAQHHRWSQLFAGQRYTPVSHDNKSICSQTDVLAPIALSERFPDAFSTYGQHHDGKQIRILKRPSTCLIGGQELRESSLQPASTFPSTRLIHDHEPRKSSVQPAPYQGSTPSSNYHRSRKSSLELERENIREAVRRGSPYARTGTYRGFGAGALKPRRHMNSNAGNRDTAEVLPHGKKPKKPALAR